MKNHKNLEDNIGENLCWVQSLKHKTKATRNLKKKKKAQLKDSAGLVPNCHNKVNITIK